MNTSAESQSSSERPESHSRRESEAGSSILGEMGKVGNQVKDYAKRQVDTVHSATNAVRDSASEMADSVISYTKEKPFQALLFAAAAGALVVAVLRAVMPSRND